MTRKRKSLIWTILIIGVVAAVVVGAILSKRKPKGTEVTVETAVIRNLVSTVSATGEIEPVTQVKISAEIPGRIVKLDVKEGDRVSAGQFLVQLDPRTYEAALESATSGLRSARGQKEKADADLRRISELVGRGMASQADLDAAKASAELAAGQLDQSIAEEKRARENLAKTYIRSPMSGIISRLNKEVGEMTLGSQFQEDVIMVVADLSKMQVRAQVDENDIIGVKLGDSTRVEIDAFPDTTFRGTVREIAQSASQSSGLSQEIQAKNFDVKILITDSVKGIRPGMTATVDIATDYRDSVLSVSLQCVTVRDKEFGKAVELKEKPEAKSSRELAAQVRAGTADTSRTLRRDQLQEGVFVFAGDSAVWKPVRTGLSSERHIEILSGIEPGDSIINGPYRVLAKDLTHGAKVHLKKEPKPGEKRKR